MCEGQKSFHKDVKAFSGRTSYLNWRVQFPGAEEKGGYSGKNTDRDRMAEAWKCTSWRCVAMPCGWESHLCEPVGEEVKPERAQQGSVLLGFAQHLTVS